MAARKKGDLVLYSGDLEVHASVERSESFALGKRFAVATLTASLSPRAKIRL